MNQQQRTKLSTVGVALAAAKQRLVNVKSEVVAIGKEIERLAQVADGIQVDQQTKLSAMEKFSATERYLNMEMELDDISEACSSMNDVDLSAVIDEVDFQCAMDSLDEAIDTIGGLSK